MSLKQKKMDQLEALRGTVAPHAVLAKVLEVIGFDVYIDDDNNERSIVCMRGVLNPDGSIIQVAEILGDCEARII